MPPRVKQEKDTETWKDRQEREQKERAERYEARRKTLEPYALCSCGEPLKIKGQSGSTIFCECSKGSYCPDSAEYGYPDSHPYFNHDQALTAVGGWVRKPSAAWLTAHAQGDKNKEPLPPLQTSPPTPQETPKPAYTEKQYTCSDCHDEIDQPQAQKTLNFIQKSLCETCIGKALT